MSNILHYNTRSMFDLIAVTRWSLHWRICGVLTLTGAFSQGLSQRWPSHAKWNVKLAHLYMRLSHLKLIELDTATLPPVFLLFFLTYPSMTFHLTSCFSLLSQGGSFFTFHMENIILLEA